MVLATYASEIKKEWKDKDIRLDYILTGITAIFIIGVLLLMWFF